MKRKKYSKQKYIVLIIIVIIIFTSIGYSIFSESINIRGTAKSSNFISGNILDLILYSSGGVYVGGTAPSNAKFTNETLENNYLTINYSRNNRGNSSSNSVHTVIYENKYPVNMTNGHVSHKIVYGSASITTLTSSITKASLIPQESSTLQVNITRTNKNAVQVLTTMSYIVNGLKQDFYFVLKYN